MPASVAFGQSQSPQEQARNSEKPIEIEADDALEWDRENQTYTAQGNASATQGDTSVHAETLIADYNKGEDDGIEIWRLTATTGVELRSPEGTAFGQKAVYLIEKGRAEMTGDNLKLVSPDQTITAEDNFLYFTNDNHFIANGNVVVTRADDILKADQVKATFKTGKTGNRELDQMEAHGNVRIITPEETLSGRVATYDPQTEIAELIGKVKIVRGPNILTGNRATVDLKTNVSRVYGAPKAGERVKGVFFPEEDNQTKTPENNIDSGKQAQEDKS